MDADIQELHECFEDASLYLYMALEGVEISSNEPLIGQKTSLLLRHEADYTPKRKHPYIGQRLENFTITNQATGEYISNHSDWVVFSVQRFLSTSGDMEGTLREIVIAWCRKEPVAENS